MTLKEFVRYLHKHTGYNFYHQGIRNEYAIHGYLSNTLKGYITEKDGKFYMLTSYHVANGILTHPNVRDKRILCYKPIGYGYYGIYEISIQQDKKPYSE